MTFCSTFSPSCRIRHRCIFLHLNKCSRNSNRAVRYSRQIFNFYWTFDRLRGTAHPRPPLATALLTPWRAENTHTAWWRKFLSGWTTFPCCRWLSGMTASVWHFLRYTLKHCCLSTVAAHCGCCCCASYINAMTSAMTQFRCHSFPR